MSTQSKRGSISRQCLHCGKPFFTFACYIRKGGGLYCSLECRSLYRRNRIQVSCEVCGVHFETTPGRTKQGWSRYCSDACMRIGRTTRGKCVCLCCGKEFEACQFRIKSGKVKYCSQKCRLHYSGRHQPRPSVEESFWNKVQKSEEGCWLWTGATVEMGYGLINRMKDGKRKAYLAHRVSYEIHYGPIPDGQMVCHNCDKNYPPGDMSYRRCVRPDHLFLGTHADNMQDMAQKGRNQHLAHRKLTPEKATEIRQKYANKEASQKKLAAEYGVSLTTIRLVIFRKIFKHAP